MSRLLQPRSVFVVHYGGDLLRGSERCTLDLLDNVDRSRFTPLLWTNSPALASAAAARSMTLEVEQFPLLLGWESPRWDLAAHLNLKSRACHAMERHQISAVHLVGAAPCQWMIPACRQLRIPAICHLHATYQTRDRYLLLAHGAQRFIGVSQEVLHNWRLDGIEDERLVVVPNAVDAERLNTGAPWSVTELAGIANADLIVAVIGSLEAAKGVDLLLRTLALTREAGVRVHLLVVGTGPELGALSVLARDLAIEPFVHFLGQRPDVGQILRGGVHMVASGSRQEAFGLSLAEAAMLGLPVSAYRVGGIPEVVDDSVTGFLARPFDAAEMAHHWILLSDSRRRRRMGEDARRRAESAFPVRRYVSAIQQQWDQMMAEGAVRRSVMTGLVRATKRYLTG